MAVLRDFRCYLCPDGTNEIREWFKHEHTRVQAKFTSRLRTLANLPYVEWHSKLYKTLHGDCKGLSGIRFLVNKIQHRPLGYRSGTNEFTILFCAREVGSKFKPKESCQIALSRKAEAEQEEDRTDALWLALE